MNDVKLIKPIIYEDDRGFFMESFNDKIEQQTGYKFVQDNHSRSKRGVIRGLHYQWNAPMGKLLRVVHGSGYDVVVDIRKGSSTYGKWEIFQLDDTNNHMLWVPPGFAQGFLALQDDTHLCYKTTALHNSEAEDAIHPLESGLDISWGDFPHKNIILSEKDKNAQTFKQYNQNPKFKI